MKYFLEELSFDTEILERKTARLTIESQPGDISQMTELIKTIVKDFRKRELEYVITRIKADDFPTIHALESQGFNLVDGFIALELKVDKSEPVSNIREGVIEDALILQEIAALSFSQTRFYNDSQIKKYQADKIYSEWIRNSILKKVADLVLVFVEKDKVYGFVTIKKNGNIPLIAVSKEKQGMGIGKLLIRAALNKLFEWDVKFSSIETQMTNVAALRTYISCGYKITDSFATFRWSSISQDKVASQE